MSGISPSSAAPLGQSADDLDHSQIISRLIAGGETELSALFMKLRDQLKAMVATRLDRRLHARVDSSDVVQEAFVRATAGLATYLECPTVHPVVWLRLIGKQLVVETHRRHFRAKRTPNMELTFVPNGDDLIVNQIADSMTSVHSTVAQEELVKRIYVLISEMSPLDREVLEMRHTDGLSLLQIATDLEIDLEAAKKRYYRALGRFRTLATDLTEG